MTDKIHPLADSLPLMSDAEYQDLLTKIKTIGLTDPITLYEGKVLDGRHRLRACQEAGIEPRFVDYTGSDPAAFVISKNLVRRHLTTSQKAMALLKLSEVVSKLGTQAEKRRLNNLKKGKQSPIASHDGIGNENGANPDTRNESDSRDAELPQRANKHATSTSAQIGTLADVSESTMDRAKSIHDHGTREDIKEVESGEKTVSQKAKEIRARQKNNAKSGTRKPSLEQKGNSTETDEELIRKEWQTCIQTIHQMLLLDPSTLPEGETKDRVARFRRALQGEILGLQDMVAMIEAVDGMFSRGREVRRQLVAKKEAARAARSQQGSRTTASAKRARKGYNPNAFFGLPSSW